MSGINPFTELRWVIEAIGISVSEQTEKFLAALDEGIEIEDEQKLLTTEEGFFDIAPNGDLYRVSVFINQKNTSKNPADLSSKDWHKFHLYRCRTIEDYPVSRQWRYKKTNNRQGLFQYIIIYNNAEYRKDQRIKGRRLHLCKNCRRQLPENFRSCDVGKFPLQQFYTHTTGTDVGEPFEYDSDQIPAFYAPNWKEIARNLKEKRCWTCESCYLDLAADQRYLHAHHCDGDPANNAIANLQALCIACHAEQPLHTHIKRQDEYKAFIQQYGER